MRVLQSFRHPPNECTRQNDGDVFMDDDDDMIYITRNKNDLLAPVNVRPNIIIIALSIHDDKTLASYETKIADIHAIQSALNHGIFGLRFVFVM